MLALIHQCPPADVAVRLAEALDVSMEYLVEGELHKRKISSRHHHLVGSISSLK